MAVLLEAGIGPISSGFVGGDHGVKLVLIERDELHGLAVRVQDQATLRGRVVPRRHLDASDAALVGGATGNGDQSLGAQG